MRGKAARQVEMLTAVTPDALVPHGHPIRRIKPMVDKALGQLSPTFYRMYAANGRASIPPENLLKACLLMALFSVRSERQFCKRLEYDLLFKWFLDLNIMDSSFDHSVFAKNRRRLLDADVAREFLLEVVAQARQQRLLSEEHFSVDGTLLEAWASVKSFRPRDDDSPPPEGGGRNPDVDFRGERRRNETHRSTTDPDARLAKKGKEARLCFGAHVLMDNREGLVWTCASPQPMAPGNGEPRWRCWRQRRERVGSPWGPIVVTTPGVSSWDAGTCWLRPMWPRSKGRPSTGAPAATMGTD